MSAEPKEPKGFAWRYALGSFGVYFAILPTTLGGLSIKVQQLVGMDHAARDLGLIMGAGFVCGPFTQPIVGRLSDNTMSRFGMRKPWLIAGALGLMISLCGVGMTTSLAAILIFWCAANILFNVVQGSLAATVADNVPEHRLGFVSGAGGAAVPIAMFLSAVTLNALPTDVARIAAPGALGGLLCLFFAFTLRDKRRTEPGVPFSLASILKSYSFHPLHYRDFGLAWLTKALIMFGFASVSTYLTLFLASAFKMSVQEQLRFNLYATISSVTMMILGSAIGGWASDKLGRRRVFVAAAGMLISLGVTVLALSPILAASAGLGLVLCGEALVGLGFGLFISVDAALCIDVLPDASTKAKDLGVLNLANSLPGMIAPLIAGTLIIPAGNALHPGSGFSLWFLLSALIAFVGGVLVFKIRGVR